MLKSLLIAGLGGFIGTVLRFAVGRYVQVYHDTVFPWATFAVNILGSLVIGILFGISEKGDFISPEWRVFLTVGLCGGFTTFSSLSLDAFILMQDKEWLRFFAYTGLSFTLGLFAVYLGRTLIKMI
jgi:CrcB protein